MAKSRYLWIPGDPPPLIAKHSQAKHDVLRDYIAKYVEVLTADPRQEELRLTLIDGFAGGGIYIEESSNSEVLGSPLLMIESIRDAEAIAQTRRHKPFRIDAQFVFVERDKATADYLKGTLRSRSYSHLIGQTIQVLHGTFADHFNDILSVIQRRGRTHRALFLLDQYGYKDVPFSILRRVFETLPHAEVILTFASEWLVDYLADTPESELIRRRIGLELPFDSIGELKRQSGDWKRVIQLALHEQIYRQSGASFYTPFFIHSIEAHRSYWLIHLSGHAKARDVMATLHWNKHNYFEHYGRPGLKMLGYNPKLDYESQGYRVFDFDAEARVITIEALLAELPSRIPKHPDKVQFSELFSVITNETPANAEIVKEVIQRLSIDGEVLIYDEHGDQRGRGVTVSAKDSVCRPRWRQIRLT